MRIKRFVLGPVGTNCYIVENEETKECFLVDLAECPPELTDYIEREGLKVKAVLLTHGHFDHIMGLHDFVRNYPVPVFAMEEEQPILCDARLNEAFSMLGCNYVYTEAGELKDGQEIEAAGFRIRVIHTPGHTAGGCCYYIPSEGCLFSGDTLFRMSVGRTDLPTGDVRQLMRSIGERLFVLPEETRVYPGHMEETDIGYEKKYNPFL